MLRGKKTYVKQKEHSGRTKNHYLPLSMSCAEISADDKSSEIAYTIWKMIYNKDGEKWLNNSMEYYIHYVPGRLRIQTPKLHENPGNAEQFERFMKGINGIAAVETRTVTGSAIIHFDEKRINCEQIIGILEKHAYFSLAHAETCDEVIEKTTEKVLGVAEKIIVDSLGGEE